MTATQWLHVHLHRMVSCKWVSDLVCVVTEMMKPKYQLHHSGSA